MLSNSRRSLYKSLHIFFKIRYQCLYVDAHVYNSLKGNYFNRSDLTCNLLRVCSTQRNDLFRRKYSKEDAGNLFGANKKANLIKQVIDKKSDLFRNTEKKIRQKGEDIVRDIKIQKLATEQKLRERKEHIIEDIRQTKAKVKEKIDEVIERENVYTIPNILCVTRIAMSPYLGYIILQENYELALGLWLLAGVSDMLDGWIARKWKSQSSKMGSFLDPMADKVLVGTLFISLTWQQLIPLPLTILIIFRDVALVAAGFVIRYRSLPPPRTLSRYFDVTHATAELAPTLISKVNTAIQLALVGTTLASPIFEFIDDRTLHVLWAVTSISTVASALSYIISKDTYKFLKR